MPRKTKDFKVPYYEAAALIGSVAELDAQTRTPSLRTRWRQEGVPADIVLPFVLGRLKDVGRELEEWEKDPSRQQMVQECIDLIRRMARKNRFRPLTGVRDLLGALAWPKEGEKEQEE